MPSYAEYGTPSQEFLDIAKDFPPPAPDHDDPKIMRQNADGLPAALNGTYSGPTDCTHIDTTIRIPSGVDIPVRIYTPNKTTSSPPPLLIYYHPGGWVVGNLELGHPNCQNFASHGAVVVSVLYRKAPEHPWPTPQTDCYDVFTIVTAGEAKEVPKFDSNKIYVFGASAGGQLSIYTAIRDLEEGKHGRIKGLLLHCPVTCWTGVFPKDWVEGETSFEQNAKAPILGEVEMNRFTRFLNAPEEALKGKYLSPLLAGKDVLSKMPKVYVQAYGMDPLRDEGILFAEKVKEAGGEAKFDVYGGFPHCFFQLLWAAPTAQKSLKDLDVAAEWMGLY